MRSASRIVFAFVGVLILAVAVTVAASTPDVESMRARAAELVLKQAEMGWGSWVLGDASDQASLYEGYEDLFTKDAIAGRIRRLLAMADKRAEELGIPDTEASLTPEMLAEAIRGLLSDTAMRARLRANAVEMQRQPGVVVAAERILSLVRAQ